MQTENVVEYSIYNFQDPESLGGFREVIMEFLTQYTADYLWHLDDFSLSYSRREERLHGSTRFGDNIEDEWFIVFMLVEISTKFPELAIRVSDNDGEFLLILVAQFLPEWVTPATIENRVFIHNGRLHIIPHEFTCKTVKDSLARLSDPIVQSQCARGIQKALLARVDPYPDCLFENPGMNHHYASAFLPENAAMVLKFAPQLIGRAVDAFYHRDMYSLQACRKMKQFSPTGSPVPTRLRFTRPLYAQIVSQKFNPPKPFRQQYQKPDINPQKKHFDLGIKIACGLEILFQEGRTSDQDDQTELTPDDVCVPENRSWVLYHESLKKKQFYGSYLEHSEPWNRRHTSAKNAYFEVYKNQKNQSEGRDVRSSTAIFRLISQLSSVDFDPVIFQEEFKEDDSDAWMTITEEDLQAMMNPFRDPTLADDDMFLDDGFGEDFDPQQLVGKMHEFMEMVSGLDGIDLQNGGQERMGGAGQMDPEFLAMWSAMEEELQGSKIGMTDDADADGNLARNFLTSFDAQQGRAGPVSTLANSMGIAVPFNRD